MTDEAVSKKMYAEWQRAFAYDRAYDPTKVEFFQRHLRAFAEANHPAQGDWSAEAAAKEAWAAYVKPVMVPNHPLPEPPVRWMIAVVPALQAAHDANRPAPSGDEETRDTLLLLNEAISLGRRDGMAGQHLSAMCSARDEIERLCEMVRPSPAPSPIAAAEARHSYGSWEAAQQPTREREGMPGQEVVSQIVAQPVAPSAGSVEAEKLLSAAEAVIDAYRAKYLTPATDRIRNDAPFRREMGELRMAWDASRAALTTRPSTTLADLPPIERAALRLAIDYALDDVRPIDLVRGDVRDALRAIRERLDADRG